MALSWCVAWGLFAAAGQAQPYAAQVERGREYLFAALAREPLAGDAAVPTRAFAVYALFATAPRNGAGQILVDGRMRALAARVRRDADARAGAAWTTSHYANYGLAALTMCLSAADADEHRPALGKLVAALLANQAPHGGWPYPGSTVPDTSQTQFALAALHDAAACGIAVPPQAWDRAAAFLVATQAAGGAGAGGFAYNPALPADGRPVPQERVTAAMTAAGLGTLLAARDRLPELRQPRRGARLPSEVVRPVAAAADEGAPAFVPTCSRAACDAAIAGAERFLARHSGLRGGFATAGREVYFCYALERVAAALKDGPLGKLLEQHDAFIAARQHPDGHWDGLDGPLAETALAALCLGRAAAAKKVPPSTLVLIPPSRLRGGEGIPGRHGHQRPDPATAAFNAFAAALKDASDEDAPAAGPQPAEDPVRQAWRHARDPRPAVRAAALSALARTRDLAAAPLLLEALGAEDAAVYEAARQGLRLLSRDPETFGLPPAARRAAGFAAARTRAKQWVEGLRLEARPDLAFAPAEPPPAAR